MRISDEAVESVCYLLDTNNTGYGDVPRGELESGLWLDLRDARRLLYDIAYAPASATREDLIEHAAELWQNLK
jgi:hypothetical protein